MRKLILSIGTAICIVTVVSQLTAQPLPAWFVTAANATFNWAETVIDFKKIKQNVPVTHNFTFTNKGDAPLVISSVQASCGCTVAEYSKEPIMPGAQGFVKATYNAAHLGVFSKTVTVNANTAEGAVQLTIKGEVVQ